MEALVIGALFARENRIGSPRYGLPVIQDSVLKLLEKWKRGCRCAPDLATHCLWE